jgi:hypothetical protein
MTKEKWFILVLAVTLALLTGVAIFDFIVMFELRSIYGFGWGFFRFLAALGTGIVVAFNLIRLLLRSSKRKRTQPENNSF